MLCDTRDYLEEISGPARKEMTEYDRSEICETREKKAKSEAVVFFFFFFPSVCAFQFNWSFRVRAVLCQKDVLQKCREGLL
jgi:hypothetical protein